MKKDFDDTNWKEEILGSLEFNQTKFASKLLKNGAKSYMQSQSILVISTPDGRN